MLGGSRAEQKEQKRIESKDRFGSAVAKNSEEKSKKPTGELAFINGDADAGRQNKDWFYSVKIKNLRSCLKNICRKNNEGIYGIFCYFSAKIFCHSVSPPSGSESE